MSSSSVLLIVAVAATLCYVATAQVCQGANMTLNVNSYSPASTRCPYGYVSYASEGRCLTYRQLVNNFLYAPCNIDSDCGPLATNPSHVATSGQFMICGTQKVCTWARSRALGDECTVNANCFGNYNTPFPAPSALEPAIYGCAKKNNTCVRATYVYTAGLNERCNYQDRDEYIRCDPTKFICSDGNSGSCRARREIGQACGAAYTPCVLTAYCNSTSNVCDAQRARGEECNAAIFDQCSQAAGVTRCIQNVCSPLRNLNEVCTTSGDCSTAVDVNAFCFAGLCTVPASLGQRCNETFSCQPNLKCVTVDATTTPNVRVCVNYAGNNETCGSGQFDNVCANNFTCVRGRCSANGNGDPCTFSGTGIAEFGNCNSGLVCINKDVCVPRVSVGGNCSTTDLLCLDNLYCTNFNVGASVSLNRTCVAYQQRGQPCDPGLSPNPALNPLNPLRCNTTLNCARGVCIEKYTLSEGAFCAQSTDCDTGFCDPMFKQCSRRKMCSTSGTVNLGGESYQCDCICSSGSENLGRCILDLCERQKQELTDCMNFNFRVNFQKSYLTPTFAFLDSQSSFYKKCEYQHQQYVNCQGYMSKLSAPAVALGDAINYNLAGINSANTMSTSLMVVVAAVVSLLLML